VNIPAPDLAGVAPDQRRVPPAAIAAVLLSAGLLVDVGVPPPPLEP
jgi:hypothetical protein